jgi:hypothetical protein
MTWISLACAQDFTLTPVDQDVDLSEVPAGIKIQETSPRIKKSYLSLQKRDQVLEKYLKEDVKGMDSFDRDLLYKSLINYDEETLIKKYPFLKNVDLKGLKNDLL